mmetsp:Transcript_53700/g.149381  ORF Transcript_53700/g.149381 Transcript_53700/m.149381 type:complete len:230 (-) Transcript_53700:507-1196(-)
MQSLLSSSFSRPATESMACSLMVAAFCMASPRNLTSLNPSSKVKTPAAHNAVYSPRESPAVASKRSTASARLRRSFSMPTMPATNTMGWQYWVSSSFSSGPLRQSSSTSYPRMPFAVANIVCTAGMSLQPSIIFKYCEPWPGNMRAAGNILLFITATKEQPSERPSEDTSMLRCTSRPSKVRLSSLRVISTPCSSNAKSASTVSFIFSLATKVCPPSIDTFTETEVAFF